jgi:hypothetical protein
VTNLNFRYLADSKSALSHRHLGPDSNLKADYRANLYLNAVCDGPLSRHLSLRGSLGCHCPVTLMVPDSGRVTYLAPAPGRRRHGATSSETRKARPEALTRLGRMRIRHLPCESALADSIGCAPSFFFPCRCLGPLSLRVRCPSRPGPAIGHRAGPRRRGLISLPLALRLSRTKRKKA